MSQPPLEKAKAVTAISTFNVLGKFKFPDDQPVLDLYWVYGIVRRVIASEGGKGASIVLRGQFGAISDIGGARQEFQAPKAYLPDALALAISNKFADLRATDSRAELQILYIVRGVKAPSNPLGYEYDAEYIFTGPSDPFATIREVAFLRRKEDQHA